MILRDYQQDAVDAAIKHIKKSLMPGLLELSGGAGKSHIMAAIAKWVNENAGKRVLCLQPTKELCRGNAKKYLATGSQASIFSASAGNKCMRHPVVFATPGTVANSLSRFGDQFGCVLIDEAHRTTRQIKMIVESMRNKNPMLRVIGMTGSPYRSKDGFIYQYDVDGSFVPEEMAANPYYNNLLCRVTTGELIDQGFLTPMHSDPKHADSYDTSSLKLKSNGKFDDAQVERVFVGQGRLTYEIVCDVVAHSQGHSGVMLFAATVQHAKEIMESLPPENSRMLGGDVNMKAADRDKLVDDFENERFKYLVSVGTLTTGVDFPHVSIIAVLRAVESAGLFQQILWRGVRLINDSVSGDIAAIAASQKPEAILLDYGENIERFNLHDDLFAPTIRAKGAAGEGVPSAVECPDCGYENEFNLRPDYLDMERDQYGYVVDLDGRPVMAQVAVEDGEPVMKPIPAHFGRRCTGQVKDPASPGVYIRCEYRWTFKECTECQHPNDIAARYCESCKAEIIDPNEKLQRDFVRVKKDPYSLSTDRVLSWSAWPHTSQSGKDVVKCEYQTEYRSFTIYYTPEARHPSAVRAWESLSRAVYRGHVAPNAEMFLQYLSKGEHPRTVTYRKQRGSDFFEAIDHNRPEDVTPVSNEAKERK